MKEPAKLVTFGKGGDTVYYSRHCTGHGYGSPEHPHAADNANHDIPDGCPALDTRPATDTDAGWRWAIKGPMVDVDLESGIDRCPTPSPIMAMAMADNEYGSLLALQKVSTAKAGPLDSVPIAVFIEGWREHGARVGAYKDGQIVWEA